MAEDETFECIVNISIICNPNWSIFIPAVLLTDLEQLYPEQYPIGYYERYNLNDMVKSDENQVELATGGRSDFSQILRSIVFDREFIPQPQYQDNINHEQYPSLEQLWSLFRAIC